MHLNKSNERRWNNCTIIKKKWDGKAMNGEGGTSCLANLRGGPSPTVDIYQLIWYWWRKQNWFCIFIIIPAILRPTAGHRPPFVGSVRIENFTNTMLRRLCRFSHDVYLHWKVRDIQISYTNFEKFGGLPRFQPTILSIIYHTSNTNATWCVVCLIFMF